MRAQESRSRVVIEGVRPELDHGRYPIKRVIGEKVRVEADIFADGHEGIRGELLFRHESQPKWTTAPVEALGNDRWRAEFRVTELGRYRYMLRAWVDRFDSWRRDLTKRVEAGDCAAIDILIGAELIDLAAHRASGADRKKLLAWAAQLRRADLPAPERQAIALDEACASLAFGYPDRQFAVSYDRELEVLVDREKARFSSWYELFPRSCADEPGRHGTFRDCEARLEYVAAMGFDVLYLPPIHPIGRSRRKGRNNAPAAGPDEVGSPWGIGSLEGGHKAVHPELGTLDDFRRLVDAAKSYGIEIALDIAFQCSPDHPYVREHPEWFRLRPDGTIQYAENPPKKYQDIYPFDFECEQRRELWEELKSVLLFWIDQGVRIFRVDNPHTKPFGFWEWAIAEIKREYPDTIFLSEAFTRPKVMYRLAKLGFTQSYSYFAWRNTAEELRSYFTELTQSEAREFVRANLWPNTPDILTEYLQYDGRPAFLTRLILAATLGANYGIYGPAFELCENRARELGSEEYLDSEKYEIRNWYLDDPGSLKDFVARVNRIRRQNPALQGDWSLWFHDVDNNQLLCYSKRSEDLSNVVLVVVNLDPHHRHAAWVHLRLEELGVDSGRPYQVHDLLSEARYIWRGARNYVELDPAVCPAHIFLVRRRIRTEQQFDYYM